jgi:hypothetical protein
LQPADQSEAKILPDPDLNPLSNPLLAANMGRWAEVYFTSPPEKREEAVGQLLRELERESGMESHRDGNESREIEGQPTTRKIEREIAEGELPQFSSPAGGEVSACAACSYENAVGQKFCGMCGELLPEPKSAAQEAEPEPISSNPWGEGEPATREGYSSYDAPTGEHRDESAAHSEHYRGEENEPAWQMAEGDVPSFAVEAESVPYRYRLYIGALLAVMLGVLVYMAWRGTTAFSGGQQSAPARAIPAAPAAEPAPEAVAPATTHGAEDVLPTGASTSARSGSALGLSAPAVTAKAVPQPNRAANVASVATPPAASRSTAASHRTEARRAPKVVSRPSHRPLPAPASSSASIAQQSGQEELATAQKYLNGNPGAGREAAPWLWKAIAKGNLTATMTLSDLYLRGDGVPKSCDQARLLLDAAARKGSSAAGTRLRNLQAFGCQ